jgi:hypothetical protein
MTVGVFECPREHEAVILRLPIAAATGSECGLALLEHLVTVAAREREEGRGGGVRSGGGRGANDKNRSLLKSITYSSEEITTQPVSSSLN